MGDGGCEGLFGGFVSSLCRDAGGLVVPRSRKEIFTLQRDSIRDQVHTGGGGESQNLLGVEQITVWDTVKELGKAPQIGRVWGSVKGGEVPGWRRVC